MTKFASRPVEVEAMQWTRGVGPGEAQQYASRIVAWVNANGGEARYDSDEAYARSQGAVALPYIEVRTKTVPEWDMARPGDVVYLLDGVFFVSDPETFERRWQPVPTVA